MINDNSPLGREGKLYYAAALLTGTTPNTPDDATWIEVGDVMDVNEPSGSTTTKKTVRGDGIRDTYAVTHIDESITFKILAKVGSAAVTAMRAAHKSGAPLAAMSLSDDLSVVGAYGPVGNWVISKFDGGKTLDGLQEFDVELKPHSQMDAYTVAS
jgi:hypothetical protein